MSKTSFLLIAAGLTIACMAGWLAASTGHANGDKYEDRAPNGPRRQRA